MPMTRNYCSNAAPEDNCVREGGAEELISPRVHDYWMKSRNDPGNRTLLAVHEVLKNL